MNFPYARFSHIDFQFFFFFLNLFSTHTFTFHVMSVDIVHFLCHTYTRHVFFLFFVSRISFLFYSSIIIEVSDNTCSAWDDTHYWVL